MRTALAEPYVVQERVGLPFEPFPSLVDGKVHVHRPDAGHRTRSSRSASTMDGCLTRISTAALLNVTAGGGSTVPTFVVEDR